MWGGIEKCYAIEAMTDPLVYWKANGSEKSTEQIMGVKW
jgi:hypothetical protein